MSRRKTIPLSALTLLLFSLLAALACWETAPHAGAPPTEERPTGVEPGKTFVVLASQAELRELREAVSAAGEPGEHGRWPVPPETLEGRWLAEADRLHQAIPGLGLVALDCKPGLCTPDPETSSQQQVQQRLVCELSCQETATAEGGEMEESAAMEVMQAEETDTTNCTWTCRLE